MKFTKWLSSENAVSFTLGVGIVFLLVNYQKLIFLVTDDEIFSYPYAVRVVVSHIESLFFGLATAVITFQSKHKSTKILYCTFESIMIFLNLNSKYITKYLGIDANFLLGTYIAIFSGVTLYFLGVLAKNYLGKGSCSGTMQNENENEQNKQYLDKYQNIVEQLRSGLSLSEIAKKCNVSKSTVQKVKLILEN